VKLPIDYTQFTFLTSQFSKEEVAFFAVYFGFLRRFYRSHGENSGISRMMDNIILSPNYQSGFLFPLEKATCSPGGYKILRKNAYARGIQSGKKSTQAVSTLELR